MKKNQHINVRMTEWKSGVLETSLERFKSLDDANEFVSKIKGEDIDIKIYDHLGNIVFSKHVPIDKNEKNPKHYPRHHKVNEHDDDMYH